jgi:hypothetical protein
MNDDQIRELLHEMRDDPVPADSLARVRQAVMARASARVGRRGLGVVWKVAVSAALAGCIAAVLLRPPARHSAPPPVQTAAAIEEKALSAVARPSPVRAVARPARAPRRQPDSEIDRQFAEYLRSVDEARRPKRPSGEDSPVIERIATENPHVTILLLQESKGNSHD